MCPFEITPAHWAILDPQIRALPALSMLCFYEAKRAFLALDLTLNPLLEEDAMDELEDELDLAGGMLALMD